MRITSFELPDVGTSAPYSKTGPSKHTNMAYALGRLYVIGGDWAHSAMDELHSMNIETGKWRRDHAGPVYPTVPAPHALQDGAGFEWWEAMKRFLVWPGSYFAYDAADAPIRDWSRGAWYLDPAANEFTHDPALFGKPGSSTGCMYGGVFDEVLERIVAFSDSSGGLAVRSWGVRAGVRLPDAPLVLARDKALPAIYFAQGKPVKIGRDVYVIGFRTDGVQAHQRPMMFRYNLDTGAVFECAPPPVDGAKIKLLEIRPATSHGKLVWPFVTGPDGEVHGIHVYTPAADSWVTDNNVPTYGNFIGNAICSLPDGRIAFSGGVFGRQQSHVWFLEALH